MLLVAKARGWQVYSRRTVAHRVVRHAGRGSRKRVLNERMSVSPCRYDRAQEQGTTRSSQRVRGWKRAYKEEREQHNIRHGGPAAREDGAPSGLADSSVASHACSFTTMM